MENTNINFNSHASTIEEGENPNVDEIQELISTLPKEMEYNRFHLYLYQGHWYPSFAIKPVISFQKHFQAHDTDIVLASIPKSGTTWLKALIYSITNRTHCAISESPVLTSSPYHLVRSVENDLYMKTHSPDLESILDPRIFCTHVPFESLPTSIKDSNCKIVYVCRNPLDQFISYWHFVQKFPSKKVDSSIPLEEAFESYYKGIHSFGPLWEHVLGYWKASPEYPDKILFLKYEDLKEDIILHTKRLAEFLGFPFSMEEEEKGVVEEISRICSFENMKNLEVNKNGKRPSGVPNNAFFRKGEVGDWSNYLTPLMAERLNKLIQEKLEGSGLSFDGSGEIQQDA